MVNFPASWVLDLRLQPEACAQVDSSMLNSRLPWPSLILSLGGVGVWEPEGGCPVFGSSTVLAGSLKAVDCWVRPALVVITSCLACRAWASDVSQLFVALQGEI